jgi:glycosyltransferase involved in cell wall biosynthesis
MKSCTKVVFDDQVFCWQEFGGISRYFYELAKRVANERDFSSTVVAPLYVNRYLAEGGVNVKGMHIPKARNSGRIISALNSLVAPSFIRSARPDVLHETYFYRRRSLVPRGCRTVLTVFDMIQEKYPDYFLARDHTTEAKRAAVMRADRVICISSNTQRDLIDIFGVAPEKTVVIHLGFTLTNQGGPEAPLRESRPFLLYVGLRGRYKNFDALLTAYSSSAALRNNYSLVAFGGGRFSAVEVERIRALGLLDSVQQISGDDALLAGLYRQSTAFVYPSLYEGFGIPPLEAMSFDCPVICSNTSSLPEVVGDAACLFDPTDIDAMRAAIEKVVGFPDYHSDLVKRGRERIQHFSWDRTAKETVEVYRELLQ